jgi:hypothetical protein
MKGRIISDWSKVNMGVKEGRDKVLGALQHFFSAPTKNPAIKSALQHFATKGEFPTEITQILEKYNITKMFDTGYEQIFDIRDFTSSNVNGFDLLDVEDGLSFSEVPVGGKAKVYSMSGTKAHVSFTRLGGGLNWDRTLIDDQQYWTLEDNAIAFRNKAMYAKAAAHYALIEAVGSTYDTAWTAPVPAALATSDRSYVAVRDAETINAATLKIITNLKDSALAGVTPDTGFVVLAPIALKGRIERALAVKSEGYLGAPAQVNFSIRPVYTTMLTATDKYFVLLPKGKLKGGNRQDLTVFSQFDLLSYSDCAVGWMRFGAAIGDTRQISRCSIA